MTTEELLKLKEAYAAWFVPGDELDLSEVADDMTKLIDELLTTRGNLATANEARQQLQDALHVRDTQLAAVTAERDAALALQDSQTRTWMAAHDRAIAERDATRAQLAAANERHEQRRVLLDQAQVIAETAERRAADAEIALAAATAKLALVERYGADQWRRGNAGKEPQEFDEWRREQSC